MPKGISLHIGLNKIDSKHYGTEGLLKGAVFDAKYMKTTAVESSFSRIQLCCTPETTTRKTIIGAIELAGKELIDGDTFLVTYSGHGGRLPNLNGDIESNDEDQTWCLYDGQLIDDELKALWKCFAKGVRIIIVSDSCFAGSINKWNGSLLQKNLLSRKKVFDDEVLLNIYQKHKAFYDGILMKQNIPDKDIVAGILLISSCRDTEVSIDGDLNGAFTASFKKAFREGPYDNYHQLMKAVKITGQTPTIKNDGNPAYNFDSKRPFKI